MRRQKESWLSRLYSKVRRYNSCRACGRKLTSQVALRIGYGSSCAKKHAELVYQEALEKQGQLRIPGI